MLGRYRLARTGVVPLREGRHAGKRHIGEVHAAGDRHLLLNVMNEG